MRDAAEESILRGRRAQQLLDDPLIAEAFEAMEADLVAAWRAAPVRDVEGREHLWLMLRASEKLRGIFVGYVEAGKVDAHNLMLAEAERAANR